MYLYHYGKNENVFNILQSKSIRLSDIRKSNDYKEMELFYPEILYKISDYYHENPFPFYYEGKEGQAAFNEIIYDTIRYIDKVFEDGSLTNFVICFSEESDLLSQWRGYSNLGRGCCLGFDKTLLKDYCEKSGVLRLEKVKYLNQSQVDELISENAKEILEELKGLREWIVAEMTHDDNDPDTDGLLSFNLISIIKGFLNDSLQYKSEGFSEESEWRLFLKSIAYKYEDLIYGKYEKINGPQWFESTINYMKNRIDFNIYPDNIVPYISIDFNEFERTPINELWIGPKSRIAEKDLKLLLRKYDYQDIDIKISNITFV